MLSREHLPYWYAFHTLRHHAVKQYLGRLKKYLPQVCLRMIFPSNYKLDILEFIKMWRLFEVDVYVLSVLSAVAFKRGWRLIEGDV